ncbi:MAG: hypothetical protein ACOVKO_05055 [Elstera sp.]
MPKSTPATTPVRPTPERRRRSELLPLPKELDAEEVPPTRLTQDVLDRYLARGDLTGRCADAALRLRALLERLYRQPGLIAPYGGRLQTAACRGNAAPSGPEEGAHRAAQSWKTLTQRLGPILSAILTAVLCEGISARDWASRSQRHPASGIEILRIALNACADHWGLPKDAAS